MPAPIPLPTDARQALDWTWQDYAPHFLALEEQPLDTENVAQWLADWTHLAAVLSEVRRRLEVATTLDTGDRDAERAFERYLENIDEPARTADQVLKTRLLSSGLEPAGYAVPLRNLRAEADLYRSENLPLFTQEKKIGQEYDRIIGAQTVEWEGATRTLAQMQPIQLEPDRDRREAAWRLVAERQLADREAIGANWTKLLDTRRRLAANAGHDSYLGFRWAQMQRFDYTPADCARFHEAIEQVAVPAASRIQERRRRALGLEKLRPWDMAVDPAGRPALRPFDGAQELIAGGARIFDQLDPALAAEYRTLCDERLLDLDNRPGKAPGGYCTDFELAGQPFIFMNAVGLHNDVQTLLHECGHAFHSFAGARLPFTHQRAIPMEFAEVASMSMELLAAPYLARERGGFYEEKDAGRAVIEHLEAVICFWPYMAVVDGFQHWVYANAEGARDPARCDAAWDALAARFMPGLDWTRLEAHRATGWQRKLHIHTHPLYYVEYGLAQLGAMQVWRRALDDAPAALAAYRSALALGGTVTLPELFAAAGARFAFDAGTLAEAVQLAESEIERRSPEEL